MTYDEYLLALDELEGELRNVTVSQTICGVLIKNADNDLAKLAMHEELFKSSIEFSKKKAKIVDLQEFLNTVNSLDKCRSSAYDIRIERRVNELKQKEANDMIETLNNKIKSLKELENDFGKVLHYDFRGNTGTIK